MNKESRRYTNDIKRMGKDLAIRPVEMYKKGYDDKTSIILKSSEIEYNELSMTKDGLKLEKPLINDVYNIEYTTPLVIDLSKSNVQSITLTDDIYITDVINFENNIEYYIILKQDSTGNHKIAWDENINILFKNSQPYDYPYSKSILKITSVNNILYADFEYDEFTDADAFKFTIDTSLGSNAGPTFQLPLREKDENNYEFIYDFNVDWGDGTSSDIRSWDDPNKEHTYDTTGGTYQISVKGVCEAWNIFDKLFTPLTNDYEKIISVDQWGYINLKNSLSMFGYCPNLTTINDNYGQWCRNVNTFENMFYKCFSLTELNVSNWNTSNVTNMNNMFINCSSLLSIEGINNWDTSNVTNMGGMFSVENAILDDDMSITNLNISDWDVSNVTDMSNMFLKCTSLTSLNLFKWNIKNVNNMQGVFGTGIGNVPLDTSSYDGLLIGWSSLTPNLQNNVLFDAPAGKYTPGGAAEAARDILINTHNWTINDGGPTT